MMFFLLKSLKDKFFEKIEEKKFGKLVKYPKSIIKVAFMYLKSMSPVIQKWEKTKQVNQFFKNYKYGAYSFNKLEDVCNLIL